jgi:hypothetical protein
MSDNQPVPYPSLGAAYPVSNASYPVAPPVPAFKPGEVATPAVEEVAAQEVETPQVASQEVSSESAVPKFFPLVPTPTSKFVATEELPTDEQAWAPFDNAAEDLQLEAAETPATEAENLFEISSSLTHEPQTNSIVLDSIPDVLTSSETFSDAGEILVTGSIELPTITGEISLANESPEADSADALDSASVTISTVAPVRAPSVINSKAQLGVLPSKRRRSQGQLMAMLTLGLLIITVGTLYVMASILGIIK